MGIEVSRSAAWERLLDYPLGVKCRVGIAFNISRFRSGWSGIVVVKMLIVSTSDKLVNLDVRIVSFFPDLEVGGAAFFFVYYISYPS